MMNATTEAMKLNFITDHGSTRDSVSIACHLLDRRTLILGADRSLGADAVLAPDPPRNAAVTELASPAAAPLSPAAAPLSPAAAPAAAPAAVDEKPPLDEPWVRLAPVGAPKPAESAVTVAVGESGVLDQDDRE